nr:MAG TPA: hypothetical protein [Caudoviricetes sp.]
MPVVTGQPHTCIKHRIGTTRPFISSRPIGALPGTDVQCSFNAHPGIFHLKGGPCKPFRKPCSEIVQNGTVSAYKNANHGQIVIICL